MNPANIPTAPEFREKVRPAMPKLWSWVEPKEYHMPHGYPSPRPLAGNAFASLMKPDDPQADLRQAYPFYFEIQARLGPHGVPTCLVPKELTHALLRTRLPKDLDFSRIRFPFPAMRFIFEEGSVVFSEGQLQFLQFALVKKGEDAVTPEQFRDHNFPQEGLRTSLNAQEDEIFTISTFRMNGSRHEWDGRDALAHWPLTEVKTVGDLLARSDSNEPEEGFLASYLPPFSDEMPKTLALLLNLILFISAKPEMVEAEAEHKVERWKRKTTKRKLHVPRKVGFKFRLAATEGLSPEATQGRKLGPGWRCGHWKDQAYGPDHSLRREIWIEPYCYGFGETG